jgi:L-lactate dehydrogenase complex protein LldE
MYRFGIPSNSPQPVSSPTRSSPKLQLALFVTCLGDAILPEVGRATVELLERLGHEVVFPPAQTCCGQMHANSGYRSEALGLARRFAAVFGGYDVVVAPSASCVGTVRELYPALARGANDAALENLVRSLGRRVFELSEFLVQRLGVEDVGACLPCRVAYHPTCHSLRVTRVGDAPLRLLRHVRGLELVPLERAEECCGFGGTFAVKNADTSGAILADKCDALERSGAQVCTAVDGSCLLQIGGGLSRRTSSVQTLHLAEILAARGAT